MWQWRCAGQCLLDNVTMTLCWSVFTWQCDNDAVLVSVYLIMWQWRCAGQCLPDNVTMTLCWSVFTWQCDNDAVLVSVYWWTNFCFRNESKQLRLRASWNRSTFLTSKWHSREWSTSVRMHLLPLCYVATPIQPRVKSVWTNKRNMVFEWLKVAGIV